MFRYKRGTRRVAIKDVSTAFLQSDPYPEDTVKYIKFKNPVNKQWEYYRQSGPIYGEDSAPVRWENTIAPFLENKDTCNNVRGESEPCAFLHPTRQLLTLLYVDDCSLDGEEDDITWGAKMLGNRLQCKETEWLDVNQPLDFLGLTVSMDSDHLYMEMHDYIQKCLEALEWQNLKPVSSPMDAPVSIDSPELSPEMKTKCLTAIGMLGWLSNTARPDIAYVHSRIGQHQSHLTESVLQALQRVFKYLKGTSEYGIRAPLYDDYENQAVSPELDPRHYYGWELFVDSDFAGNSEPQNCRRSQNGYIAMLNGAPVLWTSKVTSVAFADKSTGAAHADISSGAAEVYAAGIATMDFMHLSHVMDEIGIAFPQPYPLQIDNKAAQAFAKNTAMKAKLKHIDVSQEWVHRLRDSNICTPSYVPTDLNLADLFTKILPAQRFIVLRDRILHRIPTVSL